LKFANLITGCHRRGKPGKPGKGREIGKSQGKYKQIWNLEIYSQFPEIAPISNNYYNFLNIIFDVYNQIHSIFVHFKRFY